MIELALAWFAAGAFGSGYVEGADVRGPRPAREVRSALASVRTQLDVCVGASHVPAELFIDIEVLAAGFVDRAEVFASVGTLDQGCVVRAVRAMAFADRGSEPATHVIIHLCKHDGPCAPHPSPREIARALELHEDDIERCIDVGRRVEPTLGGSLVLAFVVARDGNAQVRVSGGSLTSTAVRQCIARELDGVRFARGERPAEVVVSWPLFFAKPSLPAPNARARTHWEAPTLLDFFGCGSAFTT